MSYCYKASLRYWFMLNYSAFKIGKLRDVEVNKFSFHLVVVQSNNWFPLFAENLREFAKYIICGLLHIIVSSSRHCNQWLEDVIFGVLSWKSPDEEAQAARLRTGGHARAACLTVIFLSRNHMYPEGTDVFTRVPERWTIKEKKIREENFRTSRGNA